MPANLSPEYHDAEARFRAAVTVEEKLEALEEMLRVIPKHKGTAKLQADLKGRIAKLKRQPKKKAGARAASHVIPRQGAGQVALAGPPNSGKSTLVDRLTNATPKVAEYPYTTHESVPGMMPYEDVGIQLIDLPPLSREHVEPWVFDLVRRADLLWLVVDCASSWDDLQTTLALLEAKHITARPAGRAPAEDESPQRWQQRPALLVVTGMDKPEASEYLEIFEALAGASWRPIPVSGTSGMGLETLARATFDALGVMRIYTKQPGKPPDHEQPFTLPQGATVGDLATLIHKDIVDRLKYARIWGPSAFDGQSVHADHVLAEGDVVELHL